MAIDVGAACTNRALSFLLTYTVVGFENPANANGTIDYVCIWFQSNFSGVEVASFVDEGSNVLSTNGITGLPDRGTGQQEYNAPGDFTAFNINTGEYIGIYATAGYIEKENTGSGYWYLSGDHIPSSSETFTAGTDRTISLYATGTEAAEGISIPVAMQNMRGGFNPIGMRGGFINAD